MISGVAWVASAQAKNGIFRLQLFMLLQEAPYQQACNRLELEALRHLLQREAQHQHVPNHL